MFIVHASIFCLKFVFLRNKLQTGQKKYREMLYYLIEKHMQKFRHFWRKKNFTWKSHLRPSYTKPFNQDLNAFEARPKGTLRPALKGLKAVGKNVP